MEHGFWQKFKQPIMVMAPMSGVTDIAFRELARKYGASLSYTEFVHSKAIIHNNQKTNVPGFFAAGDVTNNPLKQIVTACAEGAIATYSAYQELDNKK